MRYCLVCNKILKINHKKFCSRKCFKESMKGKNNSQWKGDEVGYTALHDYMYRKLKKPNKCENCDKKKNVELANKGKYDRNLDNWEWLCRSCHMLKDGRMNNLKQFKGR